MTDTGTVPIVGDVEQPTGGLRFVERTELVPLPGQDMTADMGRVVCTERTLRILQQHWQIIHYDHGVATKRGEEWRDVPLVEEETTP